MIGHEAASADRENTCMAAVGWQRVANREIYQTEVVSKIVLEKQLARHGAPVQVELVAEAWRGDAMGTALERFLRLSSGRDSE